MLGRLIKRNWELRLLLSTCHDELICRSREDNKHCNDELTITGVATVHSQAVKKQLLSAFCAVVHTKLLCYCTQSCMSFLRVICTADDTLVSRIELIATGRRRMNIL